MLKVLADIAKCLLTVTSPAGWGEVEGCHEKTMQTWSMVLPIHLHPSCFMTFTMALSLLSLGVGYHLVLVKSSPQVNVSAISDVVMSHVSNALLESHVGSELSYTLPSEASSRFPALFLVLEERRAELGIDSFGASITTMEEVFLKYVKSYTFGGWGG